MDPTLNKQQRITKEFSHSTGIHLRGAQEIIGSTEETDDESLESDNEMEIFEEEFEKIVPSASDRAIKLTDCVVIDNDNDQHIIRRCNNAGSQRGATFWNVGS